MKFRFKPFGLFCLVLALSGCQTVGGWFDSVGNHLPVIGERCEHWQCFSDSGRRESEATKRARETRDAGASSQTPPAQPAAAEGVPSTIAPLPAATYETPGRAPPYIPPTTAPAPAPTAQPQE